MNGLIPQPGDIQINENKESPKVHFSPQTKAYRIDTEKPV